MKEVRSSSVYIKWLKKLRDAEAKARIITRTRRLAIGNPGDSRFLGDISELRIDYGTGYRVYYSNHKLTDTSREIIILLCGGDKTTQQQDITNARKIARLYDEEK